MEASSTVSEEELRGAREDEFFKQRLYENPLQDLMLSLVDLLETDSEESQSLEKEKGSQPLTMVHNPIPVLIPDEKNVSISTQPSTPPYSKPRFPQSHDAADNKRKLSETSFG